MPDPRVTLLEWDTEFFGFPIARLDLDDATPESLRAIESEARALGVVCGYGSLDATTDGANLLVQRFGHRLVEVAQTFRRPSDPLAVGPSPVKVRRGGLDDIPPLEAAIATIAPWSRFGADPRFGEDAARRMHRAWVERAAGDGEERLLLVAEDDDGPVGLSTQVRTPVPRIDLVAVTKPGHGVPDALTAEFVEWGGGAELEAGPCAARNLSSIRYVERCGFRLCRTRYLYHRWFDEDPAVAG